MSLNMKIFVAIFFFIWGVVGAVLCVVNLASEPASTTNAAMFGAAGVVGFVAGSLIVRRRTY